MRTLVLGLDSANPDLLFGDERLENIRRLMAAGIFGGLETITPTTDVSAWMSMAVSQDPSSLEACVRLDRADRSYGRSRSVDCDPVRSGTIWDQFAHEGKRSVIVGVPLGDHAQAHDGVAVACIRTDGSRPCSRSEPETDREVSESLISMYQLNAAEVRSHDEEHVQREVWNVTRGHFGTVRDLLKSTSWEYFQFVDTGLNRIRRAFRHDPDSAHGFNDTHNSWSGVIRDYYKLLDDEIGTLLDQLPQDTTVVVLSVPGAQHLDGSFCINEWLTREVGINLSECDPSPTGAFILASPAIAPGGQIDGIHLLDIAPTLLELNGHAVPATMQGASIVAAIRAMTCASECDCLASDVDLIRERLSGLGYI
jgi:predicted AlkP superfamily phosphohydrolase/phosphomutase